MNRIALFLVLTGIGTTVDAAESRKWTTVDGRFSVQAELVTLSNEGVRLRNGDGKEIDVLLSKLSKADRAYLKTLQTPNKAGANDKRPKTLEANLTLKGHKHGIWCLAYSPRGHVLASGGGGSPDFRNPPGPPGEVLLWDVEKGRRTGKLPVRLGRVTAMAFSKDGKMLAVGHAPRPLDNSPQTAIWSLSATRIQSQIAFTPIDLAFTADGQHLLLGGAEMRAVSPNIQGPVPALKMWNIRKGAFERSFIEPNPNQPQPASSSPRFVVTPDGKILATPWMAAEDELQLWDTAKGQPTATMKHRSGRATAVAIAPDAEQLAYAIFDSNQIVIWDRQKQDETHVLPVNDIVNAIAFSHDGKLIAAATGWSSAGHAVVWDATTGEEIVTLTGHTDVVKDIAFSADDKYLVTGCLDQSVRVWETTFRVNK